MPLTLASDGRQTTSCEHIGRRSVRKINFLAGVCLGALAAVLVPSLALADGGKGDTVTGAGANGGVDGPLAGATGEDGASGSPSGGGGGRGGGGGVDLTTGNGAPGGAEGTSNIIPAKGLAGATGVTGQIVSLPTDISTIVTGGNGGPGAAQVAGVSTWGGGGGGGAGVRATADVTITGTGIVTGGTGGIQTNGAGGGGGVGLFSSANVTVDTGGVVAGGAGGGTNRTGGGGGGGAAAIVLTNVGTVQNGGALTGGAGGQSFLGGGGDGAAAVQLLSGGTVFNAAGGTITGGQGGNGRVDSSEGLFPGDGGAGIKGADISVVNGGTIAGGAGGARAGGDAWTPVPGHAIQFTGGVNSLEIWSSSNIVGNVTAFSAVDTFKLGGETDGTFDLSQIGAGAKYDGFGLYEKVGTSTWALTGAPVTAVPLWTVRDGTLRVDIVIDSDVDVRGGVLAGIGTVGDTTNFSGGTIAPGNGGIGTLTVAGNYTGNGGTLEVETELGDDTSPTDMLRVEGNTAGSTLLRVNNIGGTGAQTVEGIKVVDVEGASDGAFSLLGDAMVNGEQAVLAGAYAYRLYQGGITDPADGDWYLRSLGFTPSATAYESYPGVLLGLIDMPTMQQRIGNMYMPNAGSATDGYVNPEPTADVAQPEYVPLTNFWTRIEAATGHYEGGSDTGTEYDLDRYKVQVGIDGRLSESDDGILIAGVNVQYGHADADLSSDTGDGSNSTDSYGGGLTLTWLDMSGFYADAQAMVHYLESDLSSDVLGDLVDNNEGWGYGLSVELGRKLALDDAISLTPQAQLAYTSVDFDDFTDELGVDVSLDEGESLKGRLGLALGFDSYDGGESRGHVYAIANLTYEFLDAQSVDVASAAVEFKPEEFGGELGLGGAYEWSGGKYVIHGEVLGQTSFEGSYGVKGAAGFSTRF